MLYRPGLNGKESIMKASNKNAQISQRVRQNNNEIFKTFETQQLKINSNHDYFTLNQKMLIQNVKRIGIYLK